METNFTHHQSAHCENGVASNLLKFNSNTEFKQKADDMLERINKDLKQFSK